MGFTRIKIFQEHNWLWVVGAGEDEEEGEIAKTSRNERKASVFFGCHRPFLCRCFFPFTVNARSVFTEGSETAINGKFMRAIIRGSYICQQWKTMMKKIRIPFLAPQGLGRGSQLYYSDKINVGWPSSTCAHDSTSARLSYFCSKQPSEKMVHLTWFILQHDTQWRLNFLDL